MTKPLIIGLDRLAALSGLVLAGAPMAVSRAERDVFDAVTRVTQAYPDPDANDFPEGILEGFHTLSLIDAMSTLVMKFDPATTYAYNYGLDRVRFIKPVPIETPLTSTIAVLDVQPRGAGFKVLRRITVTVEGSADVAMIADWWVLVLPQSTQANEG